MPKKSFLFEVGESQSLKGKQRRGERGNKEMSQTQRIVGKYRQFPVKEDGFQ